MSKYLINDTTLISIADAVREKTGSTDLIVVSELPAAISSIPTGGGGGDIPDDAFQFKSNCAYLFSYNHWTWFLDAYGNQITTEALSSGDHMFYNSSELTEIPFDFNFNDNPVASYMFYGCAYLTSIGDLNNLSIKGAKNYMFNGCYRLRYLPNLTIRTPFEYYNYDNYTSMFQYCYSLRSIPTVWNRDLTNKTTTSQYYSKYYYCYNYCYALDELKDLGVSTATISSNCFYKTFNYCSRLKEIMFETNDGVPIVANWKNQTIDLTDYTGYAYANANIIEYNSGITVDKKVTDAASYEALKNDPDWFATNIAYSRYNHDSAVNTINSLPDCSATGGNTIKFKGAAGSATDGGAINTLTAEEIAVAAAKGWTVTLT